MPQQEEYWHLSIFIVPYKYDQYYYIIINVIIMIIIIIIITKSLTFVQNTAETFRIFLVLNPQISMAKFDHYYNI